MTATTITISDDLKRELLKVAAQLRATRGQKITMMMFSGS